MTHQKHSSLQIHNFTHSSAGLPLEAVVFTRMINITSLRQLHEQYTGRKLHCLKLLIAGSGIKTTWLGLVTETT